MAGAEGDWRPWLKKELEKGGYEVAMPEMPDIDTPVIEKWVSKLAEVAGEPDENTFFIGHSIGCQAILRYLDSHLFKPFGKVGGAIFVAGWFDLKNLESKDVEDIARPWIGLPINPNKIRRVLPKSALIISDNDPFGCFEENKKRFEEIGSKIVVMHNAGHITKEDGFEELPMIVEELEKLFKSDK